MFRNLAKCSTKAISQYLRYGAEFSCRNVPKMAGYGALAGVGISIQEGAEEASHIFVIGGALLGATAGAAPFSVPLAVAGVACLKYMQEQEHHHRDENPRSLKSARR
jgi:hypothetical protein